MAEDREEGFYWIREQFPDPTWKIATWYPISKLWKIVDSHYVIGSKVEVGPRILPPKEKKKRREGHYWVKIKDKKDWEIAYCEVDHYDMESNYWNILGTEITYDSKIFEKIGPRLNPPEEK